jgi:NifB/MoaA-like Fe-S oxidoreductase
MSRSQERQGIDDATRIRLLETDTDALEQRIGHDKNTLKTELVALKVEVQAAQSELRKEMTAGFQRCEGDNESLRRLLMGLLLTIAASSVTIVATVLITAGGVS